jgi:hypothetical protein
MASSPPPLAASPAAQVFKRQYEFVAGKLQQLEGELARREGDLDAAAVRAADTAARVDDLKLQVERWVGGGGRVALQLLACGRGCACWFCGAAALAWRQLRGLVAPASCCCPVAASRHRETRPLLTSRPLAAAPGAPPAGWRAKTSG